MRVLGFSRKWQKLSNPTFTTFRFPRKDRDWEAGEMVQVVYLPRSPHREVLGTARIISKELRGMSRGTLSHYPKVTKVTEEEVEADGFADYFIMWKWLFDTYGGYRLVKEPMNKLTIEWVQD